MSGVWVIVVAAGSGRRFGAAKQYEALGDARVLDWSLSAASAGGRRVVLVVPPGRASEPEPGVDAVVAGGDTRSASVRAGLAAVPPAAEVVVVHDAARPFAPPELFDAVVAAVRAGADGAVPGVAVVDTVKQVDEAGVVVATPPRQHLRAVQTPQAFVAAVLRAAHAAGGEGSDDAELVERHGGVVVVVPGGADNRKITQPEDLDWARDVSGRRVAPGRT